MEEPLVRPVFARRRRWTAVAIGLAVPAQLATLYALLARPDRTTYVTTVEHVQTTQVLTVPSPPVIVSIPAPPATSAPRACPPPRTDAPRVTPKFDGHIEKLSVSPTNAGWIAAWSPGDIYISTDAGRTFTERLAGSGVVHSVQFDCFGNVIASRGSMIGTYDGARETWHPVPQLDLESTPSGGGTTWEPTVTLLGGGRDVMVIGPRPGDDGGARLAVSSDLGATWRYHEFGEYSASTEAAGGFQRADGSIVAGVNVPDCMSDDIALVEVSADGHAKTKMISTAGAAFQFYGEWIYSAYGRLRRCRREVGRPPRRR